MNISYFMESLMSQLLRILSFAICAQWITLFAVQDIAAQEMRTWTSANGKFSVDAKLKSLKGENVLLERADGSTAEVPLARLSKADNRYVEEWKTKSSRPVREVREWDGKPRREAKMSGSRDVRLDKNPPWNLKPTPIKLARFNSTRQSIRLPDLNTPDFEASQFTGETAIFSSPSRDRLCLVETRSQQSGSGMRLFVRYLDVANGQISEALNTPSPRNIKPFDWSPNGKRILIQGGSGFDRNRIGVLEDRNGELLEVASWEAYSTMAPRGSRVGRHEIQYASFIDDNHVLTCSNAGILGVWEVNTLRLVWNSRVWPGSQPAVGNDRKRLFLHGPNGLVVTDAFNGDVVSSTTDLLRPGKLSCNPAGNRLICVNYGTVQVVDLETGKLVSDFAIRPGLGFASDIHWVNDDLFIVQNRLGSNHIGIHDLVDISNRCGIWVFSCRERISMDGNGKIWARERLVQDLGNGQNQLYHQISVLEPLHADAERIRQKARSGNFDFDSESGAVPFTFNARPGPQSWFFVSDAKNRLMQHLQQAGFSIQSSGGGQPGWVGTLDEKMKKVQEGQPSKMMGNMRLGVESNGQLVWEASHPNGNVYSTSDEFQKDPFSGYVLPKSIRIPSLPISGNLIEKGQWRQAFVGMDGKRFRIGTENTGLPPEGQEGRGVPPIPKPPGRGRPPGIR